MIPPNGPDLFLSILDLDPSPAFDAFEANEIRQAIGPVCRDCAELSEALREYEDLDATRLNRIDRLRLRNDSLCGCLMLAGLAIAGLLVWVVTR